VVVPSELLEQDLRRHGRHKPVSVIMNAIARLPAETTPELRGAARHALGLNAADYVVACIGRLSYEKAQDLLLQSLNGVHPTAERPIILLLAGDGPFRGQLEEAASLQGHVDVRFLGHLADVTPLYVACDLVVMPSRTEAAPNVVLEAMSYGLPIIATRVGAVPAMVSAGRDALLVDACDVAALAEKIQRAYEDAELFSTLGKSARGAVWPRFSVKRRVESIVGIYAQLSGASRIPCASP
jgi:glycosyltransferase involved in cell wall biosynthesis